MDSATVTIIALGIILFSVFSNRLQRSVITAPMAFVMFGLVIGNGGAQLVTLPSGAPAVHVLAELALIIVLFTDASRINLKLLRSEHELPIRLLAVGLPLTIATGSLVAWWMLPDLGPWQAAVLAAIVAPTDAALAQVVVTNMRVPARIRQALSVESGLNDGLCLPVFLMMVCGARLAEHPDSSGYWVQYVTLQLVLGPAVGIGLGFFGGRFIERASTRGWMTRSYMQIATLALATFAFGAAEFAGGNGFISTFCAGLSVGAACPAICKSIHEFAETEGRILVLTVFLLFGAVLFPAVASSVNLRVFAYALLSLTILRIGPVALSLLGTRERFQTGLFIGWFGPRGVASIVFAMILQHEFNLPGERMILAAAMVTVFGSVIVHGLTAYPGATWYARYANSDSDRKQ